MNSGTQVFLYVFVLVSITCCQNPCSFGSFSRCPVSKPGSSLSGNSMCLTNHSSFPQFVCRLSHQTKTKERERSRKNLLYTFPYVLESREGAFAAGLTLRRVGADERPRPNGTHTLTQSLTHPQKYCCPWNS